MMKSTFQITKPVLRIRGAHPTDNEKHKTAEWGSRQDGERPIQGVRWDIDRKQVADGRYHLNVFQHHGKVLTTGAGRWC